MFLYLVLIDVDTSLIFDFSNSLALFLYLVSSLFLLSVDILDLGEFSLLATNPNLLLVAF
jgi:hypothetical protein